MPGPAVFYRLGARHKGAIVTVRRADGSTARFTVDRVVTHRKRAFPTSSGYGDNVVAYAHLL